MTHHNSQQKVQALPAILKENRIINHTDADSLMIIHKSDPSEMHSLTAFSDHVVFLDILGPPYDETKRPCKYFAELNPENTPPPVDPEKTPPLFDLQNTPPFNPENTPAPHSSPNLENSPQRIDQSPSYLNTPQPTQVVKSVDLTGTSLPSRKKFDIPHRSSSPNTSISEHTEQSPMMSPSNSTDSSQRVWLYQDLQYINEAQFRPYLGQRPSRIMEAPTDQTISYLVNRVLGLDTLSVL